MHYDPDCLKLQYSVFDHERTRSGRALILAWILSTENLLALAHNDSFSSNSSYKFYLNTKAMAVSEPIHPKLNK